jgi:hypothetical protein
MMPISTVIERNEEAGIDTDAHASSTSSPATSP